MWPFKKCPIIVKLFLVLFNIAVIDILSTVFHVPEGRYIAIIIAGYLCHVWWKEKKPEHELAIIWTFLQPFLFGSIGAALQIKNIELRMVWKGLIIIFVGVVARMLATILATCQKKFNCKERMFMSFAWIPKATVQAAIGGVVLDEATSANHAQFMEYGTAILTIAVLAIIITAPLGAILTNTFGVKWLDRIAVPDMEEGNKAFP